ncbi:glycosyltransferase family 4 protein [Arthrobacter sp. YN]|uniref:glycosyltransferase family 4 protein n=1 Tax=Arthrobacter sp. YN TaxID=2020486 RepID=UPI000B60AC85|nr:glycosyltransferase family 4 protein [Arthrobacter sp. YN]ASN21343.1 glycosyltransferase WbuB [Arthrobacter sp. YN]
MIHVMNNLKLAMSTVIEHMTEAPFMLVLLMLRRLPSSVVGPAALIVAKVAPRSAKPLFLLASHAAGDTRGLVRRFECAAAQKISAGQARKASEVALAAGQTEWSDIFLRQASGTRHAPATSARRKWYDGDMSGAVEALAGQSAGMARQRKRLESELRVFQGWHPVLPKVSSEPQPRRVMHLLTNSVPHTASGYARRTHSILTAQQNSGWETLAVTRLGYPVQIGALTARKDDVVDGVHYTRLLPSHMAKSMDGRLQQQANELLKVARRFNPGIIHTTTHFVNGVVAREVASALDVPWVYEVRGQLADTWASTRGDEARCSERYQLFVEREAEIMRSADLVVTLGEAMKSNIVASGVPASKVLICPNAVGGSYLSEPLQHKAARLALGLDPEGLYIGTVSSLVDYEGIDDLVTAFALLAPRLSKLKLIVVGDGAAAPALQDQVRRLGLSDRTHFAGRVPPAQAHLFHQALDVFVVPRKDLAVTRAVTPLKPVEALASGRPVVASDLDALREIVHDGVNGRLVPAQNPHALAEALLELLEDAGLRLRFGAAGRQGVLDTRTWSANADLYGKAYETLRGN